MTRGGILLAQDFLVEKSTGRLGMKKTFYVSPRVLAVTLLFPLAVLAQISIDEDLNSELDELADPSKRVETENILTTTKTRRQAVSLPQPMAPAPVVQKQPTTYIEASPLIDSKADKLRRSRQEAELQTEQKIVEKLETSRMEDEQRRAEALFGDKFDNMNNKEVPAPVVTVPVTPVPVQEVPVQTTVVPPPQNQELDKEILRGEIDLALAEKEKKEEKPAEKAYFSLLAGIGDYPKAVNVTGQYALGFSIGKKITDRMLVEGAFVYSNYRVEHPSYNYNYSYNYSYSSNYWSSLYPRITDMDQYGTSLILKHHLMEGSFKPVVGGILGYTYRSFTDSQFSISSQSATSQAVDFGLMTGVDLDISESFVLGIDFRYMWNLTSRVDNGFQQTYQTQYLRNETPIERLNYYTLGIVGRTMF